MTTSPVVAGRELAAMPHARCAARLQTAPGWPYRRDRAPNPWGPTPAGHGSHHVHLVDWPRAAVLARDALLTRLVTEIGYPTGNVDERLALLSVARAGTLGHYRDAHDIAQQAAGGR